MKSLLDGRYTVRPLETAIGTGSSPSSPCLHGSADDSGKATFPLMIGSVKSMMRPTVPPYGTSTVSSHPGESCRTRSVHMTKNEPDECGKDGPRESGSQFASAAFHLFARAPTDHLAGRFSAIDVEATFIFSESDREIRLAVLKLAKQNQRYLVVSRRTGRFQNGAKQGAVSWRANARYYHCRIHVNVGASIHTQRTECGLRT